MATAVQKQIIKDVSAEENIGGWAFDMIEKLIDSNALKVERRRDLRAWAGEQRAAGNTHLFNGPPKEKTKEEKPENNPFHPSTFNISEAARLYKVSPELAASLAEKVGPGAHLGMSLLQAQRAAAAKKSLKD